MSAFANAPTRRAVSIRLVVGKQFTPSVVVELQLPLLFDNVVYTIRECLKKNLPALRAKLNSINSPRHNHSSIRLYLLEEGTALEILPETVNKRILNDAQLILSVDDHNTSDVLAVLRTSVSGGITRHSRTESGTIVPTSGLGKRQFRSYTMRLQIASDMGKCGSINAIQKALLKDLVIAGDRQLDALMEQYELDNDSEPLVRFLNSSAAQSARRKADSNMGNKLSMSMHDAMSFDQNTGGGGGGGGGGGSTGSFDFDSVMGMNGVSSSFDMNVDPLGGFGSELFVPGYAGNDGQYDGGDGGHGSMGGMNGFENGFENDFEDDLLDVMGESRSVAASASSLQFRHSRHPSSMDMGHDGLMQSGHKTLRGGSSVGMLPTHRRGGQGNQGSGSSEFGHHSFGIHSGQFNSGQFGQFDNGGGSGGGGGGGTFDGIGDVAAGARNISYGGSGIGGKAARLRKFRRAFSVDLPGEGPLFEMLSDPEVGVQVKERTRRKFLVTEKFPTCFVGSEAVTWMCENIPILYDDRSKAVKLGKSLLRKRLIAHVKNSKDFEDSHSEYYTFKQTAATTRPTAATMGGGGRSGARSGGVHSRVGSSGTIERDDDMIGPLTRIERKAKVAKYLEKRARMKKNRLEGKSHKYQGRTKFANARRRVKGRFVTLEFMNERGIKFDSEKPGWVCSTLDGAVFLTADEAVKAVDASRGIVPVVKSNTGTSEVLKL